MNKSNFYYEFENRFRGTRDQVKTTLLGYENLLNKLIDNTNAKPLLLDIGSGIGSDVPFFINGKNQYIKGVGDELLALPNLKLSHNYILIINPNIHIAYSIF